MNKLPLELVYEICDKFTDFQDTKNLLKIFNLQILKSYYIKNHNNFIKDFIKLTNNSLLKDNFKRNYFLLNKLCKDIKSLKRNLNISKHF